MHAKHQCMYFYSFFLPFIHVFLSRDPEKVGEWYEASVDLADARKKKLVVTLFVGKLSLFRTHFSSVVFLTISKELIYVISKVRFFLGVDAIPLPETTISQLDQVTVVIMVTFDYLYIYVLFELWQVRKFMLYYCDMKLISL